MSIDLTLNSIKIPAFSNYTPPFGTMVTRGIDPYSGVDNKGGLNALEVNNNIIAAFCKMRAVEVSASDSTTQVEYDAKLSISAAVAVTLALNSATYTGCKVNIVNTTSIAHTLTYPLISGGTTTTKTATLLENSITKLMWTGNTWQNISAPAVGRRVVQYPQEKSPSVIYPCTEWEELDFGGAFFRTFKSGVSDDFISDETLDLSDTDTYAQSQGTAVNGLTFTGIADTSGVQSANPTFNMSGNHDHNLNIPPFNDGGYSDWKWGGSVGYNQRQNYRTWNVSTYTMPNVSGTVSGTHKHTFTTAGTVSSEDSETSPVNLTIKVWKRIA